VHEWVSERARAREEAAAPQAKRRKGLERSMLMEWLKE
jgi:hypothetical protein